MSSRFIHLATVLALLLAFDSSSAASVPALANSIQVEQRVTTPPGGAMIKDNGLNSLAVHYHIHVPLRMHTVWLELQKSVACDFGGTLYRTTLASASVVLSPDATGTASFPSKEHPLPTGFAFRYQFTPQNAPSDTFPTDHMEWKKRLLPKGQPRLQIQHWDDWDWESADEVVIDYAEYHSFCFRWYEQTQAVAAHSAQKHFAPFISVWARGVVSLREPAPPSECASVQWVSRLSGDGASSWFVYRHRNNEAVGDYDPPTHDPLTFYSGDPQAGNVTVS